MRWFLSVGKSAVVAGGVLAKSREKIVDETCREDSYSSAAAGPFGWARSQGAAPFGSLSASGGVQLTNHPTDTQRRLVLREEDPMVQAFRAGFKAFSMTGLAFNIFVSYNNTYSWD